MPIFKVKTFTNVWLKAHEIIIEVDSSRALPSIEIVWLPDASIKESKERLRSVFRNVWIDLPPRRIILNLAPSDIRKVWTRFDLPMAVAILVMINEWNFKDIWFVESSLFFWELWLDWTVKRVNWILPSVISSLSNWYKNFFVPYENINELKYIKWINVFWVKHFSELVDFFIDWKIIDSVEWWQNLSTLNHSFDLDFKDIKWHLIAKRALTIAAAWFHNVLMIWTPWTWKTMLAKSLQSILPPMDFNEILEVSQIYSILGMLDKDQPLMIKRPFRHVHHTASKISIVGWWQNLVPWEISMSHKWILFFDELPEFPSQVLEVLRQPLEEHSIVISRVNWTVEYPANFMFVAAMNPCKCGYYKDFEKQCICTLNDVKRYQSRISWPLLDRFDIILEVPREKTEVILDKIQTDSSEILRDKVLTAWDIQNKRFQNLSISSNSNITSKDIDKFIIMESEAESLLKNAIKSLTLSPRVIHRIMKLSRTIADLDKSDKILSNHIAEAIQYRSKNMFIEN